ncbi:Inorganic phosphate transporter pho84 [Xylographa bjoerkii]|nr:Inorganic phosphate transporter pho84 [Xylographa bjoerkii]
MKWQEEAYSRKDEGGHMMSLQEYKQQTNRLGRFQLMGAGDLRLYAITGVGFFLDSYDLFIINLVTPVWQNDYWGGLQGQKSPTFPPWLRGAVNAASNIGNIIGQLTFGFLGDAFGRKFVYGKELIVLIIGTILLISLPNSIPTPTEKMWWIFAFRVLIGIGIGGDYPMSASTVSERTCLKRRGQQLGWIFSNQGWGTLTGSVVTIIILACFKEAIDNKGEYNQLDAVWRIQMGLGLVPAFATLYQRLTMPEGKKYLESKELNSPASLRGNETKASESSVSEKPDHIHGEDARDTHAVKTPNTDGIALGSRVAEHSPATSSTGVHEASHNPASEPLNEVAILQLSSRKVRFNTFFVYFSEWRHLKPLLGTTSTWFLLDIVFYGTNLNQSVLLSDIGFSAGSNEYNILLRNGVGNLIIAVAGYVPGYFFTIFFVERLGRRWIQIQGFLVVALMFAIIAGDYSHLGTAGKFVCFALAQFFFNFGPNATTFIIPAEMFPSRVRGFTHGTSAAAGKLGAILSSLLFNYLSGPTILGLANVLWIFFACCILGAISTYFLIPETKDRDADAIDYEEWVAAGSGTMDENAGKTRS